MLRVTHIPFQKFITRLNLESRDIDAFSNIHSCFKEKILTIKNYKYLCSLKFLKINTVEINGFFTVLVTLITGAAIPMLSTYFNNKQRYKRDKIRFEHEEKLEFNKQIFKSKKEYKQLQLKTIEEISSCLSYFEHSISLTSSVIETSRKMEVCEFDSLYKENLQQLIRLNSLVISIFPEFHENMMRIDGVYNQYWGYQRLLLMNNSKQDTKEFRTIQQEVIKVSNSARKEINEFVYDLIKISQKLFEKETT